MKLSIVTLISLMTLCALARSDVGDIILRGVLDLGGNRIFSLSIDGGEKTSWVAKGDAFAGYQVAEFRPTEGVLILRKDGADYPIALAAGRMRQGDSDSESKEGHMGDLLIEVSNLRQIGQAALLFADKNEGRLPTGESIYDIAEALAREAGLNAASFWISKGEVDSVSETGLTTVLSEGESSVDPVFAGQQSFGLDFAAGLPTKGLPSTTPMAWTRGLKEDGTWDESGPYGSAGGIILFVGGNVLTFEDMRNEAGGVFQLPDGTYTSNVLEALPSEVRVVGSGEGTLNGSSGLRDD